MLSDISRSFGGFEGWNGDSNKSEKGVMLGDFCVGYGAKHSTSGRRIFLFFSVDIGIYI